MKFHITERNSIGYVDSEGNDTSGRVVEVDLCNSCYNQVMKKAWAEIQEIKEKS